MFCSGKAADLTAALFSWPFPAFPGLSRPIFEFIFFPFSWQIVRLRLKTFQWQMRIGNSKEESPTTLSDNRVIRIRIRIRSELKSAKVRRGI